MWSTKLLMSGSVSVAKGWHAEHFLCWIFGFFINLFIFTGAPWILLCPRAPAIRNLGGTCPRQLYGAGAYGPLCIEGNADCWERLPNEAQRAKNQGRRPRAGWGSRAGGSKPHQLEGPGERCELLCRVLAEPWPPKIFVHYFQHSVWSLLTL